MQADGTLKTLDAGTVLEHEGYQGQIKVVDDGGTRWGTVRKQTCEQDAKVVGDWEGAAGQVSTLQQVTDDMIHSAASGLFGLGAGGAGMTTVGTGMAAIQAPVLASAVGTTNNNANNDPNNSAVLAAPPTANNPTFTSTSTNSSQAASNQPTTTEPVIYVAAGLTNIQSNPTSSTAPTTLTPPTPTVTATVTTSFTRDPAPAALVIPLVPNTPLAPSTPVAPAVIRAVVSNAATVPIAPVLEAPQVRSETLAGTEDIVLRLPSSTLLANDTSANAAADPSKPILTITAVANPINGQVGLSNGNVQFIPDPHFHGTATFTYTVTDQYGLQSTATATLEIAAVNDAPQTTGETTNASEDNVLFFNIADLLANDTDADTATDGQTLSIAGIESSKNGTATLTTDGRIKFTPDANFHGVASFTYLVSDSSGAQDTQTTPAKVLIQVAAVNDVPVATGELVTSTEDISIVFTQAQLLANDSDADTVTDGQTLSISAVTGATNGTVQLLANGNIQFTPNVNYHGQVQFTYTVTDSNGGTADATVNLTVLGVNDAPSKLGASANNWGLTPKEDKTQQVANQGAKGSDPNWLARVAARGMWVRAAGLCVSQAANDAAWRAIA